MHLGRKTAEEPICIGTLRPNRSFFEATYAEGLANYKVLGVELGSYDVERAIEAGFADGKLGIPVWVSQNELAQLDITEERAKEIAQSLVGNVRSK